MIVPPNGRRTWRFQVPTKVLKWVGFGLGFVLLGTIFSLYVASSSSLALKGYHSLQSQSKVQHRQLESLDSEVNQLKDRLQTLKSKEDALRSTLGLKPGSHMGFQFFSENIDTTWAKIEASSQDPALKSRKKIALLSREITQSLRSLGSLEKTALVLKSRFGATPSIWPIRGRIESEYGYRSHPITGRYRMHKGVDIAAWIGAPIKATAAGIIQFSGWQSGYGLCVLIDHGYGLSTLYGHLSKIFVHSGASIKKGQFVAAAGSSGESTGPHLHYEVRKWGTSISPQPFLDLDLFSAKKRIW